MTERMIPNFDYRSANHSSPRDQLGVIRKDTDDNGKERKYVYVQVATGGAGAAGKLANFTGSDGYTVDSDKTKEGAPAGFFLTTVTAEYYTYVQYRGKVESIYYSTEPDDYATMVAGTANDGYVEDAGDENDLDAAVVGTYLTGSDMNATIVH